MKTKTIVICFSNNTWLQENVQVEETVTEENFINYYIEKYQSDVERNSTLSVISPSIIHIFFLK